MKKLRMLNPAWFVKESWSYTQGYNRLRVVLYMPVAYIKFCYYTIFDK